MKTLRRIKPREQDIQAGVLALLNLTHHVAWAHKVPVGEYVIVRPLNGASVRKQLQPAINLGIIQAAQVGFIRGAPEGVLDIALQLSGVGTHCELEVKQPGQKPTAEQEARIEMIRANGGVADWVDDVDQVPDLLMRWRRELAALKVRGTRELLHYR